MGSGSGPGRGTASRRSFPHESPGADAGAGDRSARSVSADAMATWDYCSCPPRVPTPNGRPRAAIASDINHRVTSPRLSSARSYAGQFPTRYFVVYLPDALSTSRRDHAPSAVTLARAATNTCYRAPTADLRGDVAKADVYAAAYPATVCRAAPAGRRWHRSGSARRCDVVKGRPAMLWHEMQSTREHQRFRSSKSTRSIPSTTLSRMSSSYR